MLTVHLICDAQSEPTHQISGSTANFLMFTYYYSMIVDRAGLIVIFWL